MQDPDENRKQPHYKVTDVNEMPSGKLIAAAKRDINKGWRRFCEKRGIDPTVVSVENGFKIKRKGRPRKDAKPADDDDDGDTDLPDPVME